MLSFLMSSGAAAYAFVIGIGIAVYSFLMQRNGRLKSENKNLTKEIEVVKDDSEKIATIQRKQAEISSSPRPGRSLLYKQLRDISIKSDTES